jgi:TPR repeat protein
MSKSAAIAAAAVAAAAVLAIYIRHRRNTIPPARPSPQPSASAAPPPERPVAPSTAAAQLVSDCVVDHLASLKELRTRWLELQQQQQHNGKSLLFAQAAAEWSKNADAIAADWRAGKAAGHSSAASALADMHSSDELCMRWAGGAEGWTLQTDKDCEGGRVRDDDMAAQTYVLAEALGGDDCHQRLESLRQCDTAQQLLTFTGELRAQAALSHHESQHIIGTMFLHGAMGFAQDFDAAFALFGRGAAANYAPAQSSLVRARFAHVAGGAASHVIRLQGLMLVKGIGRERDPQKGCVLIAAAAAAGDADAHFFLG